MASPVQTYAVFTSVISFLSSYPHSEVKKRKSRPAVDSDSDMSVASFV